MIEHFKLKFEKKTLEELNQIIQNPENYQDDAVEAACLCLLERGEVVADSEINTETTETIQPDTHVYQIPVIPRSFRFFHCFVDTVLIFTLTAFSMQVVQIGTMEIQLWSGNKGVIVNIANLYIVTFLYYLFSELAMHRSFGKFLTKSVVVDEYGQFLNSSQAFTRTLCRFIPFESFSCLSSPSIGWHDRFSKSYVIMESDLESLRSQENPHEDSRHLISDDGL